MNRILLALLMLIFMIQTAIAGPACTISGGTITIKETSKISKDASCTLTCILLRNDRQVETSCKVDVKAGGDVQCSVSGDPSGKVLGAASSCDDASSSLSVEEPK